MCTWMRRRRLPVSILLRCRDSQIKLILLTPSGIARRSSRRSRERNNLPAWSTCSTTGGRKAPRLLTILDGGVQEGPFVLDLIYGSQEYDVEGHLWKPSTATLPTGSVNTAGLQAGAQGAHVQDWRYDCVSLHHAREGAED